MTVIEEIAAERKRQIEAEGWNAAHDDEHRRGELARAAACYAMNVGIGQGFVPIMGKERAEAAMRSCPANEQWPWASAWWKPKSPRRDLVRAAALLVAEIERIDRLHDQQRAGK